MVLRALALGDFLTGLPALRGLRRAFPDHHLYLTAPSWLRPLVEHTAAADTLIDSAPSPGGVPGPWRPSEPRQRIALEQAQLDGLVGAPERPAVAVNLRGERVATQEALLRLEPARLIAYRNAEVEETRGGPVWDPEEHEVARWCRLLTESGIAADPADLRIDPPPVDFPAAAVGAVLIHPGAGSAARHWPLQHWAAVARWELQRGCRVVVTGGPGEVELARRLAREAGLGEDSVMAGELDVRQLAAAVAAARRVVSSDTGIAHLAVAMGTPSVTVFGPMPPSRWGPPPGSRRHLALWAGRRGEPYANYTDPSMHLISHEEVIAAIEELGEARGDDQA